MPEPKCPYEFCKQPYRKGDTLVQVFIVARDPSPILASAILPEHERPPVGMTGLDAQPVLAHLECVMQSMFGKWAFAMPEEPVLAVIDRSKRGAEG